MGEMHHLAVHVHLACIGVIDPRQNLDERRLARAILSNQRLDLACAHVKADIGQGADTGERLGDAVHRDHGSGHAASQLLRMKSCARLKSVSKSGNSGRQTLVAAASSGRPAPNASTTTGPSKPVAFTARNTAAKSI